MVTLSITEAKFIAPSFCACKSVRMRRVLEKLGHTQSGSIIVYCDNSSTIKLSKNLVFHGRSKHIVVRFHFLRDLSNDGTLDLIKCNSQHQIADIMTKPLKLEVFEKLHELLRMSFIPDT